MRRQSDSTFVFDLTGFRSTRVMKTQGRTCDFKTAVITVFTFIVTAVSNPSYALTPLTNPVEAMREHPIDYIRAAACGGDPVALTALGEMLNIGDGVEVDHDEALRDLDEAASKGLSSAYLKLGKMHVMGWAMPIDYPGAMVLFRKAAQMGEANALNEIGKMYQFGNGVPRDYAVAMRYYVEARDAGSIHAFDNIGMLYQGGLGVVADAAKATEYYQKGTDLGDGWSFYRLGLLYLAGEGDAKGDDKVLDLLYQGSQTHFPASSMAEIGNYFRIGHGGKVDYDQALKWYREGASRGDAMAMFNLGLMNQNGFGTPTDTLAAREWYIKSLDQGYGLAGIALAANSVRMGTGKSDQPEAIEWLQKAAQTRDGRTDWALGLAYVWGIGTHEDLKSVSSLEEGAQRNFAIAQTALAHLYEEGSGVPLDNVRALTWLLIAQKKTKHSLDAEISKLEVKLTVQEILTAETRANEFKPANY